MQQIATDQLMRDEDRVEVPAIDPVLAPIRQRGRKRLRRDANLTLNRLEDEVGQRLDPLEGMARISIDPDADLPTRLSALKELAKYVYPTRKSVALAVEHSERPLSALSDAELEQIAAGDAPEGLSDGSGAEIVLGEGDG